MSFGVGIVDLVESDKVRPENSFWHSEFWKIGPYVTKAEFQIKSGNTKAGLSVYKELSVASLKK